MTTAIHTNKPHSIEVAGRLVGVSSEPILIDTGYWTDYSFGEIRRGWNQEPIFCFLSSEVKNSVYMFEELTDINLQQRVFNMPYTVKVRERTIGADDIPVKVDKYNLFTLFRQGREWYVTNPSFNRPLLQRAIEVSPEELFEAIERYLNPPKEEK